jgi:putative membrane protein
MLRFALILLFATALARPALAADPAQKQDAAPSPPTATFVAAAADGNRFEILSSTLALQRSQSEPLKAFANRMISEHTTAAEKLAQVLKQENLTAPSDQLAAKHKAALEELNGQLDPKAFAKAYLDAQHKAHVEAVALFKAYAKGGENAALRAFAKELLPNLEAHLQAVEKLG